MKKILSLILVTVLLLSCVSVLSACGTKAKIAGTYEMVSISGTITQNGQTVNLDEDLYEYYRLTLNKDGSALVESKGKNNTSKVEQEGEWDYEDGVIKLKSVQMGITVVEEMEWDDGVITYEAKESGQGMSVNMKITLKKK